MSLTTRSGFVYSCTAGSGTVDTLVAAGAGGNSIIGAQYFTTSDILLDFTLEHRRLDMTSGGPAGAP